MAGHRILYLCAGRVAALVLLSALSLAGVAEGGAVTSKAAAAETASQYTGFAEAMAEGQFSLDDNVSLVSLQDSITPFLSLFTDGRAVWKVDFRSVQIVNTGKPEKDVALQRDFEVYIDSSTGNFVKAVCHYRELSPAERVNAVTRETEVGLRGKEHAVPDEPPAVTLAMSLRKASERPSLAKEIIANYTQMAYKGPPRPVWVISLLGFPGRTIVPPGGPLPRILLPGITAYWHEAYEHNRVHLFVDAVSGEELLANMTPRLPFWRGHWKRLSMNEYEYPEQLDKRIHRGSHVATPIATAEEALAAAVEYTGFADTSVEGRVSVDQDVGIVSLKDSTTPFLGLFTDSRAVWKIDFYGVRWAEATRCWSFERELGDIEVYLDSATGNFVKAVCRYRELDPYADTILPAREAEEQLRRSEIFEVPDTRPTAPLIKSLLGCRYDVSTTKEVMAQYVQMTHLAFPPRPVWVMWLRGTPPVEFGPPSDSLANRLPIYQRNRIRDVIDAVSGRLLFTSTTPVVGTIPQDLAYQYTIDGRKSTLPYSTTDSSAARPAPVTSPEEAVAAAVKFTGFSSELPSIPFSDDDIRLVTLIDSTTPFLAKFRGGERAWCITFRDVRLAEPKKGQSDTNLLRTFQVYVDSATGRFLKAVCDYTPLDLEEDLTISAAEAEQEITAGGETYLESPTFPPVSMGKALLGCPRDPFTARQISVQYILLGEFWNSPRLVWVITLRGIPPLTPIGRGGSIPVYMRNQVRQVVNAKTGHVIFISNAPGMGHAVKRLRGIGPGPD